MKKTFIKVLTLIIALSMVFSVSAADFEAGKHADTSVVNIKGQIPTEELDGSAVVTVAIVEDLGLATERVAYAKELKPNEIGVFEDKFKCEASDNSVLKVCYKGEVINEALIEADIDGVSKLMNVDVVILSDRGGAFNQNTWGEMPVYTYKVAAKGIDATYQSKYTFPETKGVKAFVKVENTYGLDETFSPIVACYDKDNKLLGTKIFDNATINFEDETKTVQTAVVELPEGTVRAKAFAWNKNDLVPFGEANEGELEKINVILVGASTAQTWPASYYPEEGFGKFLGDYFNPEYVNYYNKSVSGASTTTFLDEERTLGNWDSEVTGNSGSVMDIVREGEANGIPSYVIIELGGNDRSHTKDEEGNFSPELFKANLLKMYNDVVSHGGKVIFVGVTVDAGTIVDNKVTLSSRLDLTNYKREMAELTGSDFVSCEQALADFYTSEIARLGSAENMIGYYFRDSRYFTGQFDTDEVKYSFDGLTEDNVYIDGNFEIKENLGYARDTTHTNLRGADIAAQKFYEAIVESDSILKAYTK